MKTQKYKKLTIKVKAEEYDEIIALLDEGGGRLVLDGDYLLDGGRFGRVFVVKK